MAARCVNIEHPDFKALAKEIGHSMAKSIVVANDYKIPTLNEAVAIIRGTKVKQFKHAINHIRGLKNPTIDELFKGFNGIVRKYGDDWYVVNGSRISDAPTPTAISEIEQPNIKFLQALNDTFGDIFQIIGNVNKATGLKTITGNEPTIAGTSLKTAFSKSGVELDGNVADVRSLAKAVNSIYFGDAAQFASGKIVGPPSIPNNISLPYTDKALAKKLNTLSDKFKNASKEEKPKIKSEMLKAADQAFAGLKAAMKLNIAGLYDSWNADYIARSKHWYDGANRIAQNFSKTYGISVEATSAILASLSPQNEWFNNISGADRVMDIMKNFISVPVSTAMYDNAAIQARGEPFEGVIRDLKRKYAGKSLGDVLNLILNDNANAKIYQEMAGNVLRIIDLNIHGQEVYVVTPEGVQTGLKIDTGGLQRFAWGSTNEIFKAISIFQNPDIKNISQRLGKGNKVRNFYNNIVNPNSANGEVTIDTHAIAAALLNIVSAEDASSMGLFDPNISSLYAVAKDAYTEVAKEKGVLPRELQSVTWEALRLLIKESDKKNQDTSDAINKIWDKVQSKKITNEQAIETIIGRFQYDRPQWDRPANPRTDRSGVQTSGNTVQQAERNGPDLRGQSTATGETTPGVVERNELVDKAKELSSEITNDIFRQPFIDNTEKSLSEIAEQLKGTPGEVETTRKVFGDTISDIALQLFPKEGLQVNKTGQTQEFFSDVVSGVEKFQPKKVWSPLLSFTIGQEKFKQIFDKFKGNFDNHIAASIPTFRETQIKVGSALKDMYQGGALIYDIGGSEGGFVKAITQSSEGKIKSINLDVNEQMQKAHEATPVKGADYVKEAFYESYTDEETGKTYPKHVPTEKADVVHESMVFQFISPERKQFIKEIKDNYIKPDGIVLLEEKVLPATQEEWTKNEAKKDSYKLQSFPQEAITEKAEKVLVGMKQNQTSESDLVDNLKANFSVVAAYWDAGNFKGYIASDSQEKVDEFLSSLGGKITSEYSSNERVAGHVIKEVTGQEFYKALNAVMKNRPADSVQITPNDLEYYQGIVEDGGRLLLSDDNKFGIYITENGYIGGLFKDPSMSEKVSKPMLDLAIKYGGYYMDSYSTLESGYVKNGFRPVARLKFDENLAPSNYKETVLKGQPDVVFYAHDPAGNYVAGEGKIVDDYQEGLDEAKNFFSRTDIKAAEVKVNEQVLSDMTEKTQEEEKPETDGWKPIDSVEDFQKLNDKEWSREQRKRFSLDQVVRMLKLKFGIKVNFINDPVSHWRGKYSKGTITLNEASINPDTPFHEIFHPFIDVIKKDDPALYTQLMDELKNSPEGKETFEAVKNNYPELSEEEMWDEALVERLGYLSAVKNMAGEKSSMLDKFIDWLKTILAKMGINTQTFKSDMSLDQFADLLINPSFVFDLAKKIDNENHYERYSKLSNNFDEVINRVRQKLRADSVSRPKGMNEDTSKRKYFSGKTAEALDADPRDLKAIDNFIISSAINLKKLNERFEEFKQKFDAKKVKSPEDVAELGKLLNEIEDCVTLYEDVDLLINSVMDEFPDADDAIGNLKKNYRREAALINDYKAYAKELIVNWLYPHGKAAINQAIATDKPFTIVSRTTYEAVQKELQATGITPTKRQILETAFKRELASYLTLAKKDASAVTQFLGPLLHSRDPLSALIARAVIEEYTGALKKGLHVQERLTKIVRQTRGLQIFNTNKDHFNFYAKYLRQATSYEYQGLDKNGVDSYKEVKRWAFHEEYRWDEFYKAKREMEKAIGVAPSKNDTAKWNIWKNKSDNWYAVNTEQKTINGKQVRVPASKYKSAEFTALQSDKLFTEMYKAYKDANDKVGKAGLKYGIIPQNKLKLATPEKGKVAKDVVDQLRLFIGDEDQVYFAQKNNLKEKRSVPVPFTRLVDDNELSFDLLNSVAKYAVSSEKYNSISQIEPHVNILKNFIGGNASLGLDARQVVKQSANGIKALSKAERKAMQVDAVRINQQLTSFLDDVIYGQPEKKTIVKMFNAKFKVEHKNGTVEIIKGFDNMAEHIGMPDLDYHGFEVGTERELKDYKVTMVRDTWNWSLNKTGNNLGLITAFSQLALNPIAGAVNIVRAKLETFIEGVGGRYFNLAHAAKAEAIYFRALGSGDFFEDLKGGKPSFLSSMAIDYDAIQGELQDELGKNIQGSLAGKLFRRNHLFLMQKGGEHYVQTQLMVAMMLKQQLKLNTGEQISLYDAKKREYDGTLKMSDTNWTSEKDVDFRQTVKFVNTNMHGNYNKLDKAYIQRTWWGSLLMMFRKHIYTGFASRYRGIFGQGGYVNYQTGNYTQGYYLTFMQGVVKQVRSLIEQKRMGTLTDEEKYAFRKIAADFAAMALLMLAFKSFDDDDDDEDFNDVMALISRRLISEGVQYTPVVGTLDLAKVVTNPAASVSTVDKLWDAISQSISDPTAEYERSGAGYKAGQNKAAVKWGRAIPVYRQYVNAVEPERLLEFYGKNSIWFLKPDAGKTGEEK